MPVTRFFRIFKNGKSREIVLSEEMARRSIEAAQKSAPIGCDQWSIESIERDVPLTDGVVYDCGTPEKTKSHVRWQCPICGEEHHTDLHGGESNPALWFCEGGWVDDIVLVRWLAESESPAIDPWRQSVTPEDLKGPGDLWSADEGSRSAAIMWTSRRVVRPRVPRLLELLETDTYANRRHIVRALGKIGGADAEVSLVRLLNTENGLILGDLVQALTEMGTVLPVELLKRLESHELEWVRQNARVALKRASF